MTQVLEAGIDFLGEEESGEFESLRPAILSLRIQTSLNGLNVWVNLSHFFEILA